MSQIKADFLFLVQTYVVMEYFNGAVAVTAAHLATRINDACLYDSQNCGSTMLASKAIDFCEWASNKEKRPMPDWIILEGK
jgi:hypothetical protein